MCIRDRFQVYFFIVYGGMRHNGNDDARQVTYTVADVYKRQAICRPWTSSLAGRGCRGWSCYGGDCEPLLRRAPAWPLPVRHRSAQQIALRYFQEDQLRVFSIVMLVYDKEAQADLEAIVSSIQITK